MSPATGSLLLCEEVHIFSPALLETAKVLVFLLVLGVSRVWCFDFAVASHKCCWPSKGVKDCTCTPGDRKGSCFLLVLGVSRVWCFDFAVASHKCCWPSKGVKDCTHLCAQRPASSHTFPHLQSKLIGVVVLSNINNRFLCKVVLQTCATFIHGFL